LRTPSTAIGRAGRCWAGETVSLLSWKAISLPIESAVINSWSVCLLLLCVIKDPQQEVSEQDCFCCLGRSSYRTSGWLGGFFRRPIAPLNSSMRATCSPRSIEADHKGAVLLERVLDKLHANAGVGCFDELPNANLDLSEGLEHGSIVVTNNCWLSEPIRVPRRR
jgi:hypothetical protein